MGKGRPANRPKGFKKSAGHKKGRAPVDLDLVYENVVLGKANARHIGVNGVVQHGEGSVPGKRPVNTELPGLGQHYCDSCARYFTTEHAATVHLKSKFHKKRVKELKSGVVPYGVDPNDYQIPAEKYPKIVRKPKEDEPTVAMTE